MNLPFPPYTDDEIYLRAFEEIVPPVLAAYRPDVVVTQLGVDSFFNDPLARLNLTLRGFEQLVRRLRDLLPCWVALGGGGYDVSNVARAWTLVWAVMNDVDLEDGLPEGYLAEAAGARGSMTAACGGRAGPRSTASGRMSGERRSESSTP